MGNQGRETDESKSSNLNPEQIDSSNDSNETKEPNSHSRECQNTQVPMDFADVVFSTMSKQSVEIENSTVDDETTTKLHSKKDMETLSHEKDTSQLHNGGEKKTSNLDLDSKELVPTVINDEKKTSISFESTGMDPNHVSVSVDFSEENVVVVDVPQLSSEDLNDAIENNDEPIETTMPQTSSNNSHDLPQNDISHRPAEPVDTVARCRPKSVEFSAEPDQVHISPTLLSTNQYTNPPARESPCYTTDHETSTCVESSEEESSDASEALQRRCRGRRRSAFSSSESEEESEEEISSRAAASRSTSDNTNTQNNQQKNENSIDNSKTKNQESNDSKNNDDINNKQQDQEIDSQIKVKKTSKPETKKIEESTTEKKPEAKLALKKFSGSAIKALEAQRRNQELQKNLMSNKKQTLPGLPEVLAKKEEKKTKKSMFPWRKNEEKQDTKK